MYSVSTNFRLELIEPSAREGSIFFTLVERGERGASEEEEKNMTQINWASKQRQS